LVGLAGRKVGALLTDGVELKLFTALQSAVEAEGATLEVIAPAIAGVTASDGTVIEGKHKVGGGPSVLFDAVAILTSAEGVTPLLKNAAVRDLMPRCLHRAGQPAPKADRERAVDANESGLWFTSLVSLPRVPSVNPADGDFLSGSEVLWKGQIPQRGRLRLTHVARVIDITSDDA
jgi:hypothetical protein